MKLGMKINLQQVLQVHNHDTNQISYLIENDGEWVEISEEKYNQLLEANQ